MKVLVLGHGGHGKGTFCKMLEEECGITALSSSMASMPYILPALVASDPDRFEGLDEVEAFEHRREYRRLFKELITLYNSPDRSALAKLVLRQADVYDGMRCAREYAASCHLFDHTIWIDASLRCPADPTMTIKFDPTRMLWVDNNQEGDLDYLERQVIRLRSQLV